MTPWYVNVGGGVEEIRLDVFDVKSLTGGQAAVTTEVGHLGLH